MALDLKRHRFTVVEYHQMAEAGILGEDDRVELVEGEIVEMTPIGRRHADCVNRLTDVFVPTFRDVALVSVQNPVRLGERTELQPDLALLRRVPGPHGSDNPGPKEIFLLVEVAGTTIESDRRVKVPLYARHGIPEVWLVDLEQETITVYRDPTPRGYRTARVVRRGEEIAPDAFPDRVLAVADLLPG